MLTDVSPDSIEFQIRPDSAIFIRRSPPRVLKPPWHAWGSERLSGFLGSSVFSELAGDPSLELAQVTRKHEAVAGFAKKRQGPKGLRQADFLGRDKSLTL